jgi:hypothetical protein
VPRVRGGDPRPLRQVPQGRPGALRGGAGLYKLNPVQLTHSLKAPDCIRPLNLSSEKPVSKYEVKTRFQSLKFAFKCNLYRYNGEAGRFLGEGLAFLEDVTPAGEALHKVGGRGSVMTPDLTLCLLSALAT